ncbi:hypothetical protein GLOTRDRAFT_133050 [Gloeophyllum trabeum ATCC 11539]|uniref:Uncharacterized protein n=1 Tax=Gloeophyllum trabeum (strain ATCC 11539 / FP-39264 / Madison 617) TaxID=670483 RepID=S7PWH1_GLOTA|nr:uncharacterized protein GLOTRDRAFT_133050 [Gloeophyllum trabeum ATCC 11539]EPQ51682.1 hypothetical protein GLOTRDRAFT_133050 [Gloeophyllum trabeum ATCC 11539]
MKYEGVESRGAALLLRLQLPSCPLSPIPVWARTRTRSSKPDRSTGKEPDEEEAMGARSSFLLAPSTHARPLFTAKPPYEDARTPASSPPPEWPQGSVSTMESGGGAHLRVTPIHVRSSPLPIATRDDSANEEPAASATPPFIPQSTRALPLPR